MSAIDVAISGLQSSQTWLDVISNNVSNSQTVGFKSSRANFASLVSQGLTAASGPDTAENLGGINPSQLGLGVSVNNIQSLFTQGAVQTTGNSTDIAIQGSGFLVVKQGENTVYTRAGNLTVDSQGDLVTSSGGLVQGWSQTITRTPNTPAMVTITDSLTTTSTPGDIEIPNNLELSPKATSSIGNSATAGGVMLGGNLDSSTPLMPVAQQLPMAGAATAAQLAGFTPQATNTFTVYDSLGTAYTFTMEWQQVANTPAAAPSWQWTMWNTTGGAAPNAGAVWPAAGSEVATSGGFVAAGLGGANNSAGNVTFNPDGSLATNGVATGQNIQIALTDADGALTPMTFSINLGTPNIGGVAGLRNGITGDYGDGTTNPATGVYTPNESIFTSSSDGYAQGNLTGVSFSQTGQINATFSNSQTVAIAQLAMANFSNEAGLSSVGTTEYAATADSGQPQIGTAGANGVGTITGGALEASNVDLTVELTNMLLAQNMFEANSRVVTTADTVLANLVQMAQNVQG
jgi:flagellar hook protein FlgE